MKNPTEATKYLTDLGCKYLRLCDLDGEIIINQNPAKNSSPAAVKAQAEKINNYLKMCQDGSYIVQGRTSPAAKPTSVHYTKGEQGPATAANAPNPAPSRTISDSGENVLSYAAALKMQEELATLRAENSRLSDLVEQLQADLEEMEAAEAETQMSDSPQVTALGQLAAILPAVVDKFFEQQKEKNEIEKAKLMHMMQGNFNGSRVPNTEQTHEQY